MNFDLESLHEVFTHGTMQEAYFKGLHFTIHGR